MTETLVDNPVDRARRSVGGASELARLIGISSQAVTQWRKIPIERVSDVERATGIPREELRPDIFQPSPKQAGQ